MCNVKNKMLLLGMDGKMNRICDGSYDAAKQHIAVNTEIL